MNKQLKNRVKKARAALAREQHEDALARDLINDIRYGNRLLSHAQDHERRLLRAQDHETTWKILDTMEKTAEFHQIGWVILTIVSFLSSLVSISSHFIDKGTPAPLGVVFTSVLVFAVAYYKACQATALEALCMRAKSLL